MLLIIGFIFLCLWKIAFSVGKETEGEKLWNVQTKQSDVLYLCLEDTFARIQSRLFKLTDEANDKLHFTILANKIPNGLINQLEDYLKKNENTRLIVIDTLQKVRNTSTDSSYASDYGDVSLLKDIADKYKIAIILVHHIKKEEREKEFEYEL